MYIVYNKNTTYPVAHYACKSSAKKTAEKLGSDYAYATRETYAENFSVDK